MKTKFLFKGVTSVEFLDSGHEVKNVEDVLTGALIEVEDVGAGQIILTVEDGRKKQGFLHDHPNKQRDCNLDKDHIIVDKGDWIIARQNKKKSSKKSS